MTEFFGLSKLVQTRASNSPDRAGLPDLSRKPIQDSGTTSPILEDLMDEAAEFIKNGQGLDEAWVATAAAFLARAISDGDAAGVVGSQEAFRRLASAVHVAAQEATTPSWQAHDPAPTGSFLAGDRIGRDLAHQVLVQVNVLIEVADAGAGVVRPRALGVKLEPGSMAARILAALSQHTAKLNEDLRREIDTTTTQLSRACNGLASRGLITRRTHGRRATWTLTAAGAEAARALKALRTDELAADRSSSATTWARSAEEFEKAVDSWATAIAVAFPNTTQEGCEQPTETPVCRYVRIPAVDAGAGYDSLRQRPPVIVAGDQPAAYLRSDCWIDDETETKSRTS